jgi:hypothetical protein
LPMTLISACFNNKNKSYCGMVPEGWKDRKTFEAQDANKYGFLLSTILATLMFVGVPLFGFAKSYKMFDAPMRILEKLPYMTWLVDWIARWTAGEATMDDIPEDVQEFAKGKESRRNAGLYSGMGPGVSSKNKTHDQECCEADHKDGGRCSDGECYCKCHVDEEKSDANSIIEECTDGDPGLECTGGLGSKAQAWVRNNQRVFVRSQDESIDSRRERLDAEFGPKISESQQSPIRPEEKGKEKEVEKTTEKRKCTECGIELSPYSIAVCNLCLKKKYAMKVAESSGQEIVLVEPLKNESIFGFDFCGSKELILWLVTKEMLKEAWDYARMRSVQVYDHVSNHKAKYLAGAMGVITVGAALAAFLLKDEDTPSWISEGKAARHSRTRVAPDRWSGKGGRKKNYIPSGSTEEDLDAQDIAEERYEREQEERERAQDLEDRYREEEQRAADKRRDFRNAQEENECIHFASCPTMPMKIDAKAECHTACGGHHCAHFATCIPKNETTESLTPVARKLFELKAKHLDSALPRYAVARNLRSVRKAKTTPKTYTHKEFLAFKHLQSVNPITMTEESLLGKTRTIHTDVASHVFKVLYDGQMTSTGTIVADKLVVPLHSHQVGGSVTIVNPKTSVQIKGEIIPIADDLGVFVHGGLVKAKAWTFEVPTTGIAMQLGYSAPAQVEPSHGVGFYSSSGLYDAPTEAGNCGGPVVSCMTGALLGFHIAGSDNVNRFIPLTTELIQKLKASAPVLKAMLFQ